MDRLLSMQVFERVADEGSFASAARALDLSPSAVTRLVADLERHLGVRLLQRSTRRLSLTEAGLAYLQRVRDILQEIDEAHAATSASIRDLSGLLRLHASPALHSQVVAPLISGFRQRYPRIVLDIDVDSSGDPLVENFDVALIPTDEALDAGMVARKVAESQAVLVASPAYLQRRGRPRHPQDLAGHDCLRLKEPEGRPHPLRLWPELGADPPASVAVHPVLWANHSDTLLQAALDGVGITSVAVDVATPRLAQGSLERVLPDWISGRMAIYAALPSRKFIPRRTRVFLDFLVEQTRERAGQARAAFA